MTDEPASSDRVRPFAALRLLRPLLSAHPFGVAVVVLLGILASAAEGIGITLFIPLVQSIEPGAAGGVLPASLASLVGAVPADRRVVVLPLLILGAIALKNALVSPTTASCRGCSRTSAPICAPVSSIDCWQCAGSRSSAPMREPC